MRTYTEREVAALLRNGSLSAVYPGEKGIRTWQELSRSYLTIRKDLPRGMNRLKALYPSGGIAGAGTPGSSPPVSIGFLETLGFEGEYPSPRQAQCAWGTESLETP